MSIEPTLLPIAPPAMHRIESTDRFGRFELMPLEPGFGTTIGNAMRRVLISSLPGAAVTWIKIRDVAHEFTDVPNAKEDVTEVVLNVKKVRLRSFSDEPVTLHLTLQREGPVTAGDIELPSTVEVVNPDQYLLTLAGDDQEFDMELTVERGKGYIPADARQSDVIGMIPVDSIFSPIVKVNFSVEPTRVQQTTNYDRLILDVWTDGTMTAEDAIAQTAEILVSHFSLLGGAGLPGLLAPSEKPLPSGVDIPTSIYNTPIEELDLSVRAYNCLKRSNITKVGQVLQMTEDDLLAVRHFGKKSLDELVDRLALRAVPGVIPDDLSDESEE
ncbi:MAG: DNA-directed RNA polymerase subunit alpha [Chloroflexota bacterium]